MKCCWHYRLRCCCYYGPRRRFSISTHWGQMTHTCVVKLTIIGSDNGLSPGRRQAIIYTHAGILSIGPMGTNFSQILIEICIFSFKKMHLKMSSGKWRPLWLALNVLRTAKYRIMCRRHFLHHLLQPMPCILISVNFVQLTTFEHWFIQWLGAE